MHERSLKFRAGACWRSSHTAYRREASIINYMHKTAVFRIYRRQLVENEEQPEPA
jgi:hypothetical protein